MQADSLQNEKNSLTDTVVVNSESPQIFIEEASIDNGKHNYPFTEFMTRDIQPDWILYISLSLLILVAWLRLVYTKFIINENSYSKFISLLVETLNDKYLNQYPSHFRFESQISLGHPFYSKNFPFQKQILSSPLNFYLEWDDIPLILLGFIPDNLNRFIISLIQKESVHDIPINFLNQISSFSVLSKNEIEHRVQKLVDLIVNKKQETDPMEG